MWNGGTQTGSPVVPCSSCQTMVIESFFMLPDESLVEQRQWEWELCIHTPTIIPAFSGASIMNVQEIVF